MNSARFEDGAFLAEQRLVAHVGLVTPPELRPDRRRGSQVALEGDLPAWSSRH